MIDSKKRIICCETGKGKEHDFALFKRSNLKINQKIKIYADSCYLGITKIHKNSEIPHKKSKNHKLTKEEKKENIALSKKRIIIENVNAEIKVFKILGQKYRNKRKKLDLRLSFICSILNMNRGV